MMNSTIVIPSPEFVLFAGVHFPVLSAIFGAFGVGLGHLVSPVPPEPIGWRRHIGIIALGEVLMLAITVTTGQQPLLVLGWSIGIGFSGIAIFAALGAQVKAGVTSIVETTIATIAATIAARKDKQ